MFRHLLKEYFPRNYAKLSNTSVLPGHPKKGPQFSLHAIWVFLECSAGVREDNRPTELGKIRQTASRFSKRLLENCFFWTVTES